MFLTLGFTQMILLQFLHTRVLRYSSSTPSYVVFPIDSPQRMPASLEIVMNRDMLLLEPLFFESVERL